MSNAAARGADRPMRADAAHDQRRIPATAHRLLANRVFGFTSDEVAIAGGIGIDLNY